MSEQPPPTGESLDFLWKVHSYTNDYIRFADQKAGLVLAVESGLIAAMYAAKLHHACSLTRFNFQERTVADTALGFVSFIGFLFLGVGVGFALFAIAPRLWTQVWSTFRERLYNSLSVGTLAGSVFWKEVLANGNAVAYLARVRGLDEAGREDAVGRHVYVLAGVANAKFGWINLSLAFGAVGGLFAVAAMFFG